MISQSIFYHDCNDTVWNLTCAVRWSLCYNVKLMSHQHEAAAEWPAAEWFLLGLMMMVMMMQFLGCVRKKKRPSQAWVQNVYVKNKSALADIHSSLMKC